jgi:hypothetical protein
MATKSSGRRASARRLLGAAQFAVAFALAMVGRVQAQHVELPLSVGSTARMWSEALGEERQLLIYPEMIVVGVTNSRLKGHLGGLFNACARPSRWP